MPIITFPDGQKKEFPQPISVEAIATAISKRLAEKAIVGKVNDTLVDLSHVVANDACVTIITADNADNSEGIDVIRHSTAHLLAHAVKELFPEAQPTIGPLIEDGFYYDFYYKPGFTESDLERIEAKMAELAKRDDVVQRIVMSRDDALKLFADRGETYKVKLIEEMPEEKTVSLYQQGDFIDLCRGPHVPNTGKLRVFKLTKLAGAYWRGNSQNEVLQRIYGTAWPTKAALDEYLKQIELAKQRDHRLLGKKMDLFHLQEEAPGMVFWHPNGWSIYKELRNYISGKTAQFGYQEVCTPQLLDRSLWEKSGHWDKFGGGNMFTTESENHTYVMKPMNCPGHIQIFKQGLKSYRDLPIRYAEFGCCHRNECSGTLHGIFRVRGFVQDDGHIFCTEDQIISEAAAYIEQLCSVYNYLGFPNIIVKLATRPEHRVGADELWDKAEKALAYVLDQKAMQWELSPGEGAFYGPKIEFSLRDSLNRVWQCGTLQLDFSMPQRLGAYYIAEDGSKKAPVMLHRAMLGSLERFIGVLLEHTGGDLPLWLAPTQAVVLNITDAQEEYVRNITAELRKFNFRVNFDLRNEKIGFKIREHSIQRVPYLLVAGNKEVESQTIAVRTREGKDLGVKTLTETIEILKGGISN